MHDITIVRVILILLYDFPHLLLWFLKALNVARVRLMTLFQF